MMEILSNKNTKIKTVYHISDIHISRYYERHNEYNIVFSRLYEEIKRDTKNALIVITGDILHEKNNLSPSQLMLAKDFFYNLSMILPVICIIGNHDISIHQNSIDAVSPILDKLYTKNKIYLLLDNKNYQYNNIIFGVTSMFTDTVTPCVDDTDKIKIGLYHGMIIGAKNNNGFGLASEGCFKVSDFKNYYDYVMLGDVHKHMYLDTDKTVAYAGSLLQTRFGESLIEHGVLKWNLETGESKLIEIRNDYGFLKIRVDKNGFNKDDIQYIPKYPTIKLEYTDISSSKANEYMNELRIRYNANCSLVRTVNDAVNITIGRGKDEKKVIDINDNKMVIRLIMNHIKTNYKYDKKTRNAVKSKIVSVIKKLNYNYNNQVKQFTLKKLTFDNFFNFGEDNSLDYTLMNNIVGITGNSFVGKSTASIDALLYAIFGKCSRGDKFDAVNVEKKIMRTEVEFDINGSEYKISRERKIISKARSAENTVLYMNGDNISAESVDKTNNKIEDIICDYDNFVNVVIMLQNKTTSFIDLSNNGKKSLVCGLLKLDIFNDILSKVRTEICQINYYLSSLRGTSSDRPNRKNFDKNEKCSLLVDEIKKHETDFDNVNNKLGIIIEKYNNMTKNILEYELKLSNNKISEDTYTNIEKKINDIRQNRINKEKLLQDNKKKLMFLGEQLKKNTKMNNIIKEKLKQFGDVETKYINYNKEKKDKIDTLRDRYEKLLSERIPCDDDDDINIKQFKTTKNRIGDLSSNILKYEKNITELKNTLIDVSDNEICDNYDILLNLQKDVERLEKNIQSSDTCIIELKRKIENLDSHNYDPSCSFCMQYSVTKDKIKYNTDLNILKKKNKHDKKLLNKKKNKLKKYIRYETEYNRYINNIKINEENKNNIKLLELKLDIDKKNVEKLQLTIDRYNKNIKINHINTNIDKECVLLKEKIIKLEMSICNEYEEYKQLSSKNIDLNNIITKINNNMDSITNIVNRDNNIILLLRKEEEKYMEDMNIYNLNINTIRKHKELVKVYNNISTNRQLFTENAKKISNKLIELKSKLAIEQHKLKEYTEKETDKGILELIINTLDKNGLIDNILSKTIMPKLTCDVNILLGHIADYKIDIQYDKGRFKILKIHNNNIINIDTLSGCERFIANIAFKLALDRYNNYIKTKFIIIDEVFTCCDDVNIAKLPSLFDYIKNQYKFAIIISHDERIKKLYDYRIEVIKKNLYSYVCN